MREVRLLAIAPSCRDWKFGFGNSIVGMCHRVAQRGIAGINLKEYSFVSIGGSSCPSRYRQRALDQAIEQGYTHLFMVDDDHIFPADILEGMFARNLPVVVANSCRKIENEIAGIALGFDGKPINSAGKTGAEEVKFVGISSFGLIDLEAIKHVAKPHFECLWMPERGDYLGEDLYFCAKLRQNGVKIYIDHDASNKQGHIGDYAYRFEREGFQPIQKNEFEQAPVPPDPTPKRSFLRLLKPSRKEAA